MITLLMCSGQPATSFQSNGRTRYWTPLGWATGASAIGGDYELGANLIARDSYTLSNLYVNIPVNTINTGTSTFRVRKNGGNGNQNLSIGAGATGTFEDTTNTDSLVDGNLFCVLCTTSGASGSMSITVISLLVNGNTSVVGLGYEDSTSFNTTEYLPIGGRVVAHPTESRSQLTIRTPITFSNLRTYISANTCNGSSTFRTRKNLGNGNMNLSIGAGATGAFEDTTNTDGYVNGDEANFQMVVSGTAGLVVYVSPHMKSSVKINVCANPTGAFGFVYVGLDADIASSSSTESDVQVDSRASITFRNLLVNVIVSATEVFYIRFRINGGNGNQVISVGAGTTGIFEDNVNFDSAVDGNLINYGATGGGIPPPTCSIISVQEGGLVYSPSTRSANIASKLAAAGII